MNFSLLFAFFLLYELMLILTMWKTGLACLAISGTKKKKRWWWASRAVQNVSLTAFRIELSLETDRDSLWPPCLDKGNSHTYRDIEVTVDILPGGNYYCAFIGSDALSMPYKIDSLTLWQCVCERERVQDVTCFRGMGVCE